VRGRVADPPLQNIRGDLWSDWVFLRKGFFAALAASLALAAWASVREKGFLCELCVRNGFFQNKLLKSSHPAAKKLI